MDPMCGSGTTLRVAKRLDRHYIGIDICSKVCEFMNQEPCTDYNDPLDKIYIDDCLTVMQKLYDNHGSFIDLIYVDPPFGRNSVDKQFGINWNDFPIDYDILKELYGTSIINQMSYEMKAYISWLNPRVELMHKLLKPTGSFYLHCDPQC